MLNQAATRCCRCHIVLAKMPGVWLLQIAPPYFSNDGHETLGMQPPPLMCIINIDAALSMISLPPGSTVSMRHHNELLASIGSADVAAPFEPSFMAIGLIFFPPLPNRNRQTLRLTSNVQPWVPASVRLRVHTSTIKLSSPRTSLQ